MASTDYTTVAVSGFTVVVVAVFTYASILDVSALVGGWSGKKLQLWGALGVPAWLSKPLVMWLQSIFHLVLSLFLILAYGELHTLAAIAATLTSGLYVVFVWRAWRLRRPCGCFQEVSPASRRDILRSAALLFSAVGILIGGLRGMTWRMSWEITPVGSVLMVILVLAAIVVGVSLAPPKALPLDTGTAGKAVLQTSVTSVEKVEEYQRTEIPRVFILAGKEEVQLRTLALKRPTLLFYLSGACEPCSDLMKRLPEYQEKLPEVDFVGISGHDPKELDLPEGMRRYQDRNNVLKWLMRLSSPSALLLTPDGMISGGPVRSGRMIEEFISDIRAELDSVRQDA